MLTKYWDDNYENLQSTDLICLANWLLSYEEQLKEYFQDERLQQGAKLLIKTYRMNSIQGPKDVVQGIVKFEKQNKNQQNSEDGIHTSSTPQDLFKIINTTFDMVYSICKHREIGICMAEYANTIIKHYQQLVQEMLESTDLDIY